MSQELKVIIKELPIGLIDENDGQIPDVPANPRRITDEAFEQLKKSIKESPEMKNLDEVKVYPFNGRYIAIGGNHRLRGYKELKWKNVLCKVLPEDTPKAKLREYIMKENMQYASNDPYKLQSWGKDELTDWGVEIPKIENEKKEKVIPSNFEFQYHLEIQCTDEKEQEELYNEMIERGYKCHILTL